MVPVNSTSTLVDTGSSRTPWTFTGAMNTPLLGYGRALDSPSAYLSIVGGRDYGLSGLSAVETMNSTSPGVSVAFWLYRTAQQPGANATRLFTILGNSFSGSSSYTVSITPRSGSNYTIDVSWPSCVGIAQFASPLLQTPLSNIGMHYVAVTHGAVQGVRVYIDGLPAVYKSQTAPSQKCDISSSAWPSSFPASAAYVGAYGSADAGTFYLMDAAFFTKQLTPSDVSATWIAGPINPAAPPPPPTFAPKGAGYALPRAAACQTRPPIHRYGDFQPAPFAGGVLADSNTVAPWPATWRTAQNASSPVAANAYPTLGALNTYYTNGAYADAGPVNLTGTGLTVGLLFSNTAMVGDSHACTPATSVTPVPEGMPSQWALFDIGGYSVYSQVSQCTPGFTNGIMNAATYVTSADGTSTALQGAATPRSPLLPAVNERYTWVTFGSNGARIYVNGLLWGAAPGVGYTTAGVFSAQWARFYFGDMHGGGQGPMTITLHDLQVYDRELQPGEVASLTRGIGYVC